MVAYFGRLTYRRRACLTSLQRWAPKDKTVAASIDDFEQDASEITTWLNRAIEEAGIGDRVITFSASHEAVADYMRAADIVVLPSILKEQYGRVIPEAMACECAIIVSGIGALPELVGDAGVIVRPGDVLGLSKA